MKQRLRCDETPAWPQLLSYFEQHGRHFDVRADFERDPARFSRFSLSAPHVFADLSKNRIDAQAEALLMQLARETGLEAHRDAMLAGEAINSTEGRAVMHHLLRNQHCTDPDGAVLPVFQGTVADAAMPDVNSTLRDMLAFAESVRADTQITDIVNIGIGGSDLGPQMAVVALQAHELPGKRFHYVSNVDGDELGEVLEQIDPAHTLFLVASKPFTTRETMTNDHRARRWFL